MPKWQPGVLAYFTFCVSTVAPKAAPQRNPHPCTGARQRPRHVRSTVESGYFLGSCFLSVRAQRGPLLRLEAEAR